MNNVEFDKALTEWLARAQGIVNDYYERMGYTMTPDTLTIDPKGVKYIKIVRGGSVHCFIDKSNGDVLKAESWRKPAKHARGNIFTIGKEGVSAHGGLYLK